MDSDILEFRNDGEEIARKCLSILRHNYVLEIAGLEKLKRIGQKKLLYVERPEGYQPREIYLQLINIIDGKKVYRFIYRKRQLWETVEMYSASFVFT